MYVLTRSYRYALDTDPKSSHALASQIGGRCHLISISQDDKGKVEQVYATQDPELENIALYEFGGLFTNKARYLLFGVVKGCLMVWDRQSGDIVHGLNHGEGTDLSLGYTIRCQTDRDLHVFLDQSIQAVSVSTFHDDMDMCRQLTRYLVVVRWQPICGRPCPNGNTSGTTVLVRPASGLTVTRADNVTGVDVICCRFPSALRC